MSYKKLLYFFLLISLVIGALFIPEHVLRINRIECRSQYIECDPQIVKKLDGVMGKSLYAAKSQVQSILKNESSVSKFSIQFKLYQTIKVNLLIKKPRFAIQDSESKKTALITSEGEVVAISEDTSLPKVRKNEKLKNVGEKVSDQDLFCLRILDSLFYSYQINQGEIIEGGFKVHFPDGFDVIFPLSGDKERTLGALSFILSGLKQDNKDLRIEDIRIIDLRFKNPVVR